MLKQGLLNLTLTELAQSYRNKACSVSQVVQQVLAQQGLMQDLNTLISSTPLHRLQHATAQAQDRQDRGELLGALDGVPVVVKDNYCTSWAPTTCASNMLRHYTPPYTATVVTRLEKAGAIVIGKSNLDEFGMGSGGVNSKFGPVKNLYRSGRPYSLTGLKHKCGGLEDGEWLVSGGSSGGSAVAVSAGLAYCGLGSDTGGSIRNPAAYCGLVGLKPSYGALPRTGLISLVNSMDVPGLLTKSCDDAAAVMAVVAGRHSSDSTSQDVESGTRQLKSLPHLQGVTVGIPREYHCQGLHPHILRHWQQLADVMSAAGAEVVSVSLPNTLHAPACYSVLNTCEVASNFTRYTGLEYGSQVSCSHSMEAQYALSRAQGLSQVVRDRVLAGNYFLLRRNRARYHDAAAKVRRLILQDFERVWRAGVDVLLAPTTLFAAPKPSLFESKDYSELTYLQDVCTSPANLAGLPALALPVGYTTSTSSTHDSSHLPDDGHLRSTHHDIEGLPLSLQLLGPYGADMKLLELGKWVESTLNVPRATIEDPL